MDYARSIADALISDLGGCEPQNRGRRILAIGEEMATPDPLGAECIIMFASPQPSFFHLRIDSCGKCKCSVDTDRSVAGDPGNPAYLGRAVLQKHAIGPSSHSPCSAHYHGRRGLELRKHQRSGIVTATDGKFNQWNVEDNRNLEAAVKAEATDIRGIVLQESPQRCEPIPESSTGGR